MGNRFGGVAAVIGAVLATLLVVTDGRGGTAGFDDIKVGQALDVKGRLVGTKTIRAQKIEIQRGVATKQEISGDVEAVDGGEKTLRILGTQVAPSPTAVLKDHEDKPLEFSSLKAGRRVKAEGRLGDDGVFRAEEIEVAKPEPEEGVALEGQVEKLDAERKTITMVGFTVVVTPTTSIKVEKP